MQARDSLYALRGPVFRDCNVSTKARQVSAYATPDFRPSGKANACYGTELEFVVDADGLVETKSATVVRSTDDQFTEAVLATLGRLRFEPAVLNGVKVRQIVQQHWGVATAVVVVAPGSRPGPPPRGSVQTKC